VNDFIPETCPRCKGWVWHRRDPCKCPERPTRPNPVGFRKALGDRIQKQRAGRGVSLDNLASAAGMSKAGLWQIVQGVSEPRASTLAALATALGVTADSLLFGRNVVTTDELRAAAERLRRVFHEDEFSPLDYELSDEDAEQIRDDVLALAAQYPAQEPT
jgi:transcriptional regulator with XRE-family HTH domain